MSKLNLEELIPGALWVDKERGMYVRRQTEEKDRFYACYPSEEKQYGYYTTKQRAAQDLEALIKPTLDAQDKQWISTQVERYAKDWRLQSEVAQALYDGIRHERDRVSALLSDEKFSEALKCGCGMHNAIRKHLGLDPEP